VTERWDETFGPTLTTRLAGGGVVVLAVVVLALVLFAPDGTNVTGPSDLALVVVVCGALATLGAALASTRMTVRLDRLLEIRIGPFWYRRRIDPTTVTAAVAVDLRPDRSGTGARLGRNGMVVLLDAGSGVRVSVAGMRDVAFRCDDPPRLIAALHERGATVV